MLVGGLAFAINQAAAADLTGQVIGVLDGDTIEVLISGAPVRVRLSDIDAPELSQAFGRVSKRSLSELAFGKEVALAERGRDRYGRRIARAYAGSVDLNLEQVRRGMAWAYRRYTADPAILSAESSARASSLGLWHGPNPTPPWEYRRSEK